MSSTDPTEHRLLLMRHAKAAYPDHCTDHQRPLAGKGRKEAVAVGEWLAETGWVPDLIICSDAARTQETAALVCEGLGTSPSIEPLENLYEAGVSAVFDAISATESRVTTLLVVGHEPTMSATTAALCDKFAPFPTAAVAQIELENWQVEPGSGNLVAVHSS